MSSGTNPSHRSHPRREIATVAAAARRRLTALRAAAGVTTAARRCRITTLTCRAFERAADVTLGQSGRRRAVDRAGRRPHRRVIAASLTQSATDLTSTARRRALRRAYAATASGSPTAARSSRAGSSLACFPTRSILRPRAASADGRAARARRRLASQSSTSLGDPRPSSDPFRRRRATTPFDSMPGCALAASAIRRSTVADAAAGRRYCSTSSCVDGSSARSPIRRRPRASDPLHDQARSSRLRLLHRATDVQHVRPDGIDPSQSSNFDLRRVRPDGAEHAARST